MYAEAFVHRFIKDLIKAEATEKQEAKEPAPAVAKLQFSS
jgi:hypothetical protein